jgi:hypothetical protein
VIVLTDREAATLVVALKTGEHGRGYTEAYSHLLAGARRFAQDPGAADPADRREHRDSSGAEHRAARDTGPWGDERFWP